MWRVSERAESVVRSSAVEECKFKSERRDCGFGEGRIRLREVRMGISGSIRAGSRPGESGEKIRGDMVWMRRVWCLRCAANAMWAVMSLCGRRRDRRQRMSGGIGVLLRVCVVELSACLLCCTVLKAGLRPKFLQGVCNPLDYEIGLAPIRFQVLTCQDLNGRHSRRKR